MILAHADLFGFIIVAGAVVGGMFLGWHFPQPKWLKRGGK